MTRARARPSKVLPEPPADRTAELRRRILRAEQVIVTRGAVALVAAAAAVSVASLVGLAAPLGAVCAFLAFAVHLLVLRVAVVGPVLSSLRSRARRIVARWLIRIAYLTGAAWGYGWMHVPLVNVLVAPLTCGVLTFATTRYALWTSTRDQRGEPVHPVEGALLALLAVLVVTAVLAIVLFAEIVVHVVPWVAQWWQGASLHR